ncbi:MAG: zf-TFIIB domain-containing protein [Mariniblastus sp.]|nr:zf-TFIIB domain-containing protein [Mariniblastus sp.]
MQTVHALDHLHCAACNTFSFPNELEESFETIKPSGKVTAFQCPICDVGLESGTLFDNTEVCFCRNCRGFVVDTASFGLMATQVRSLYTGLEDQPIPIDPKQLDIHQPCPVCSEDMDAHPYYGPGNIVLDTCMQCKLVWLDHGELGRIIRAPGKRICNDSGNFESSVLREHFNSQCR